MASLGLLVLACLIFAWSQNIGCARIDRGVAKGVEANLTRAVRKARG